MVIFFENNHGKYAAGMLFGKFQSKKKRWAVIKIDSKFAEFETISKRHGDVREFAVNPLACIAFGAIVNSLGYRTTPDPRFNFIKSNIHFTCAARSGTKRRLNIDVISHLGIFYRMNPAWCEWIR